MNQSSSYCNKTIVFVLKNWPIRTLYPIYGVFWLDDFAVQVQKLFSKGYDQFSIMWTVCKTGMFIIETLIIFGFNIKICSSMTWQKR
jgi:hypothetical protein